MVNISERKKENTEKEGSVICRLLEQGKLDSMLEEYTRKCHESEEASSQKAKKRAMFPNIAGFCRYIGTGLSDFYDLQTKNLTEYDRLLAVFEDEALNSDVSAAMLSLYMKMRMLYSFEENVGNGEGVSYCFEHDIYVDGE